MPAPYDAVNLKARFNSGDKPTQQDFADLIDTFFILNQQALATATDALNAANGFAATAGVKVFCTGLATGTPNDADKEDDFGVASVQSLTVIGGLRTLRVNFTSGLFPDDNYTKFLIAIVNAQPVDWTIVAVNAAFIDFKVPDGCRYHLAIFGSH